MPFSLCVGGLSRCVWLSRATRQVVKGATAQAMMNRAAALVKWEGIMPEKTRIQVMLRRSTSSLVAIVAVVVVAVAALQEFGETMTIAESRVAPP